MSDKNVFLLYGAEKYIINEKINEIVNEIEQKTGERPELVFLDDDETSITQLQNNLTYSSLFSLSKVIIIKQPFWLQKATRKSGKINEVLEVFKYYFTEDYPDQYLLVSTEELNKSNPLVKLFMEKAKVIECQALDQMGLSKWLVTRLNAKGLQANNEALKLMAGSGQDMYYLVNLIEKLSLAGLTNITPGHLQDELEINSEIKIFKLTDALFNKNIKAGLAALHQLIEQGQTAPYFIAMINNQFMSLAKVKAAVDKGYTRTQIEQVTGLKSFVVRNMLNHVGKYSWPKLWDVFALLLDTDIKLKTTSQDKNILMESLIIKICHK